MNRTWLVRLVLLVPVVALAAWPLSEQARVWRAPQPDKVRWADEAGSTASCFDVDIAPGYAVSFATDAHALTQVSLDEAAATARDVVSREHNWPFFRYALYGAGPHLVYLDAPDGQQFLAWARMLIWDESADGRRGTGDLVYVDARNGDALLIATGIPVNVPSLTCAAIVGEFERVVDPLLSLIGLGIYVLLLIVVWSLRRAWRLMKQNRRAAKAAK